MCFFFFSAQLPSDAYKCKLFVVSHYSVNSAFSKLRHLIPTEPIDRKLSKIETLRLAQSYIDHLAAVLITGK